VKHLALGLAAYLLALLFTPPATLVDAAVRHASDGVLRVAEARGSIWSGAGQLELVDSLRHAGVAKAVSWHLLPTSLWRGHVVYEVQLADASAPAHVTISPSQLELADAVLEIPAGAIVIAAPKLAPAQLTGDLSISTAHMIVDRSGVRGSATLRWRNAGSGLSPVAPLGEYEMHVDSDETGMRATLATVKGPLELKGHGSWRRETPSAFSATARMPPEYVEQIAPLLRLIASESADGTFQLVLR
jgi:general secretion pathway protein N